MSTEDKTTGSRRRSKRNGEDVHSTEAVRSRDAHATGKSERRNTRTDDKERLRPYLCKKGNGIQQAISGNAQATIVEGWPLSFELEGREYKNEGILSDSSGEAIIFTVNREGTKYALKLYYHDPEHRPNHAILEKISKLKGSGLLVNIVSHGEWENPAALGEKLDYELMDFCEGGSMDNVVLNSDEKKLSEVAVRIASAIDFLSKHGILHRDIKPANFFYADKAKTQIVLADFGISVECPPGGVCEIDEMRSPVYAAPEFYTNVPGEPAEVGVESDYFSLGVSLLCLWMGKAKLTANESQLLRSKLNETLPVPTNLSPHMASLIKALTRLKMSDRATFNDIKRWVKGENLDLESETKQSDFKVVFNSAKQQVAHSPSELAQLLLEDKVLGRKYLYSGRITRWLEETGRNEIAVNVEEVVETIYPSNQEAGLMAVAYMLDPSMDYVDPTGGHHTDPREISLKIFQEHAKMQQEILRPDSNLMIYLHAHKMDKTVAALREYVDSEQFDTGEETLNGFIACYYLAVLLNPNLTFPAHTDNGWVDVNTVEELLAIYHSDGHLSAINYHLLRSRAFIVWLAGRDPALAGKIRMLHDNASDEVNSLYFNSDSAYRIAYELNPQADLLFGTDPQSKDRCYSIGQIGKYLNTRLNAMVLGETDADALIREFDEMDTTHVGDYLRARGQQYAKYLEWNRYCMNTDDEENNQKAGPYDIVIGAYKSVTGFLSHAPTYPIDGQLITSLSDVDKLPREIVSNALGEKIRWINSDGEVIPWLDAWLTVFFQENPKLDLSQQFVYEKETAKYIEFIGKHASNNYYYDRYSTAIGKIDQATVKLDKSEKSVTAKRNIFLLFGGIPTLLLILGVLSWGLPEVNPISGHFWATTLICGAGIAWFSTMSFGEFWNSLIPGAVGGVICAGLLYAGFRWFPSALCITVGTILILGGLIAIYYLFKREKVDTGGKQIRGDEFEYRQLDSLYYAYHQQDEALDNVITKYSEWQQSYNKTNKDNISFVGWCWSSVVWPLFVLWYFITPQMSGSNSWASEVEGIKAKAGQWVIGKWEAKYAGGNTRIVCDIDSVAEGKKIFGTITIAGQTPVKATGTVYNRNDTLPKSFTFYPEEHEFGKQELSAEYVNSDKKMKGHYYDRKGIMHQLKFLSTPLPAKTDPQKPADTDKKVKRKPETPRNESENEESPASGLWEDTM